MTHDPASRAPGRLQRTIADLLGKRWVWAFAMLLVVAAPLVRAFMAEIPAMPPDQGTLPEFSLTDESGKAFGSKELAGKVWVADFIFTSCSDVCPRLTKAMTEARYRLRNLKGTVHFVSLTVNPGQDTPQRLFEYARSNHALGAGDWSFLTGTVDDLRRLVVDGFKMAFGDAPPTGDEAATASVSASDAAIQLFQASHGQKLVLVDPQRRIRGYYNPDKAGLDRLVLHAGLIANLPQEAPGPRPRDLPPL